MKSILTSILLALGISILFVTTLKISIFVYMVVHFIIFSIIRINLPLKLNKFFYIKISIFNIVFFMIYIFERYSSKGNSLNSIEFLSILIIFMDIYVTFIVLYENKDDHTIINESNQSLIMKRDKELIVLEEHLSEFNVVGLNGEWGAGKSFLIEKLKDKLKNEYEYIEIDLLTSNLNEVSMFLIETIEKKLLENGILPRYTNNLKKNLSSFKFLGKIQNLISVTLSSSDLKSDIFKNFIKETKKIKGKKILIIFEDIDRIENKEVIKEVFSISEKFSGESIKIIYQYDENILLEQGFTFKYLEKYIPYKLYLTKLDIREIIDVLLEDKPKDNNLVIASDFDFLHILSNNRFNVLRRFFNSQNELNYNFNHLPFRKIENMVNETFYRMKKHKDILEYKEIIIAFFAIKHFLPDKFQMIWNRNKVNLFDIFIFVDNTNAEHSIIDLIENDSDIYEELFFDDTNPHKDKNISNYCILKIFNFDLVKESDFTDINRFNYLKKVATNIHEKQNRILNKLIYEGKSQLTNDEFLKEKFVEMVLENPGDKKEEYRNFLVYMHNLKEYQTDNRTVFLIGVNYAESLFKAYNSSYSSSQEYLDLLKFYFEYIKEGRILDFATIKFLNEVNIDSVSALVEYMKLFNSLNIETNFNNQSEFYSFLEKFIIEIFSLGILEYTYNADYYNLTNLSYDRLEDFKETLEVLKEKTEDLGIKMDNLSLDSPRDTLISTLEFINKILSIISNETDYVEREERGILVNPLRSEFINQKTIDELIEMKNQTSDEEILLLINNSFNKNDLTITEVNMLIDELNLNE